MQTLPLFIQSLGWTILHTAWQSMAIWIIFKIADYTLPRQQAKAKYALGLVSLLALTGAFFVTFFWQWQHWSTLSNMVKTSQGFITTAQQQIVNTNYTRATTSFSLLTLLQHAEHYFPMVAMGYIAGMTLMLLRLLTGSVQYYNLRNSNIIAPPADLINLVQKLRVILKLQKNVQLKLSTTILTPVMTGWIKPAILLPVAMVNNISAEAMEAILLHELAHIRRHDFLINIFQMIAETILFFNPLSWYLSRYISREREHCCDDIVVQHTGQPLTYAKTLASIATETFMQPVLAMTGNTKKPMHLFNRIKRITEMKKQPINYGRLTAALIICGLMASMIMQFLPANAQPQKKTTKKTTVVKKQNTVPQNEDTDAALDETPMGIDTMTQSVVEHMMQQTLLDSNFMDSTISLSLNAAEEAINSIDFKEIFASVDSGLKAAMPEVRRAMREAFDNKQDIADYQKDMQEYKKDMAEFQKDMLEYKRDLKEFQKKDLKESFDVYKKDMEQYKRDVEQYREDILQYQKDLKSAKSTSQPPVPPAPPAPPAPVNVAPIQPPMPPVAPAPPTPPAAHEEHVADDVINQLIEEKKISAKNYDVLLNKDKMIIDGKKQDAATHNRYYNLFGNDGSTSIHAIKKQKSSTK